MSDALQDFLRKCDEALAAPMVPRPKPRPRSKIEGDAEVIPISAHPHYLPCKILVGLAMRQQAVREAMEKNRQWFDPPDPAA